MDKMVVEADCIPGGIDGEAWVGSDGGERNGWNLDRSKSPKRCRQIANPILKQ
jgi:hypothetical protein